MHVLNSMLSAAVDASMRPLQHVTPFVAIAVVSLLTALAALLVFKATSDQQRILAVQRLIHATIFELRLFSDDIPSVLRAQVEMLRHTATYLRLSLVPTLWMLLPLFVIVTHLEFFFGYKPLEPGHPALVTVTLAATDGGRSGNPGAAREAPHVAIQANSGTVRFDTPAVWLPGAGELAWRLTPERLGTYELRLRIGDHALSKTLQVGERLIRCSPVRTAAGFVNELTYPSEPPIEAPGTGAVSVSYPRRGIEVGPWELHWLIVYFGLTLLFALILRRPLGVSF